ncbi:MAG: hypothetical protein EBS20_10280 [Actinobacteria bacterium]|nr:hypothetical protein [Actinomycetota bacterium]
MTQSTDPADSTRLHRDAVIARLVADGRLTEADARAIADAPRWSTPIGELVGYLAAFIVAAGLVRLIVALIDGVDEVVLAATAGLVGLCLVPAVRLLARRTGALQRMAEATELVAVGLLATSVGLFTHTLVTDDVRPGVDPWDVNRDAAPWSILPPAALATAWGLYRRRDTAIAGALTTAAASLSMMGAITALLDTSATVGAAMFTTLACGLITIATGRRVADVTLRLVAAVVLVSATSVWFGEHDVLAGTAPVLIVAACLFAIAGQRQWIELLAASSVMVLIAVVGATMRVVDDPVLEGITVVLIGGAVAMATWWTARRSRPRHLSAPPKRR